MADSSALVAQVALVPLAEAWLVYVNGELKSLLYIEGKGKPRDN